MLSLLDVAERTRQGPKMADMDWNMALYAKMAELADRFQISVPPNASRRAIALAVANIAARGAPWALDVLLAPDEAAE